MKTYKQFIEESIVPLAPLAYKGGEPLPPPDQEALKKIKAELDKDNLKRKGAIRPTTTPTTPTTKKPRVKLADIRLVDQTSGRRR